LVACAQVIKWDTVDNGTVCAQVVQQSAVNNDNLTIEKLLIAVKLLCILSGTFLCKNMKKITSKVG
jgi:hypothetical protein